MLVRVESSNPGEPRPSRRLSGRGLFITLFALLIAGSAALVATGAAGAGSAGGASAASSASQAGLSLSVMTTQQALQAVLGSGAAPSSAGAAPVSGATATVTAADGSRRSDARLIRVATAAAPS